MTRRYRKFVPIETCMNDVLRLTQNGMSSAEIVAELGVGQAAIERAWSAAGGKQAFAQNGPSAKKPAPAPAAAPVMSGEHLRKLAQLGKKRESDGALTQFCAETGLKRADVLRCLQSRYRTTEKAPRMLMARLVADKSI